MLVRISGTGHFELDDAATAELHRLDGPLTAAMHDGNEAEFHRVLHQIVSFIHDNGRPISHDAVLPSELIVPPDDISLEEARRFFHDDDIMSPVPA